VYKRCSVLSKVAQNSVIIGARLNVLDAAIAIAIPSEVCPSHQWSTPERFKISRYDLCHTHDRCLRIVVVPSVTLWCPNVNLKARRFGTEKNNHSRVSYHNVPPLGLD